MKGKFDQVNRVSSEAVQAKTGKTWDEWITILDQAGARKKSHPEIVAYLREQHGVGPWWQQMVTVGYEQARGKRDLHERPDGFQVSASKTYGVSVAQLYAAWHDEAARQEWMPGRGALKVNKATVNKSIRAVWKDGKTHVDISFFAKGEAKSSVSVQHSQLANARQTERMKAFWVKALEKLAGTLQG